MVKAPLSVSPVPLTSEYVWVSPESGSDVVNVPTVVPMGELSATTTEDKATPVGA